MAERVAKYSSVLGIFGGSEPLTVLFLGFLCLGKRDVVWEVGFNGR